MYQEIQQNIRISASELQASLDDGFKLSKILFNLTTIPMLLMDDQQIILKVNSGWARFSGWKKSRLVGRKAHTFFKQDQLEDFLELQQSLQSDEQCVRGEFWLRRFQGTSVRSELTLQRVDLLDQLIYILYLEHSAQAGQEDNAPLQDKGGQQALQILNRALQSLEREHGRYQSNLDHHIRVNLLPVLGKMSREAKQELRDSYHEILSRELKSLTNNQAVEVDRDLLKLTPTEIEICQYIQTGLSSKEIAAMTHSSFDTVQTHRKNIRRKMGLIGKKTPLCTYLRVKKRLPARSSRLEAR